MQTMKNLPVIPLADAEFWQDPYPLLAELRAKNRAAVNDQGAVVPLHWGDCEWTIKGTDFINEGIEFLERRGFNEGDALHTWRKHALGVMEGPDHLRVRKLVSGALSKRNIEPLRPLIRKQAHAILDMFVDKGEIEAFRYYSMYLPRLVMMEFLGVEKDELSGSEKAMAGGNIVDCFGPQVTDAMRDNANHCIQAAMDHVAMLYEKRRAQPQDDLLTQLLTAETEDGKLSHGELITLFSTIFGSGASTGCTIAAGLLELTQNPEQAGLLRKEPERWKKGACEEVLRMRPAIYAIGQKAARAQEAFGLPFTAEQSLSVILGAPNRDPARWQDPERFDITRDPALWSLSLGIGPHFCIGQAIARSTIEEGLAVFVQRCHELELKENPRWVPFVAENKLESLQLAFRPAVGGVTVK